MEHEVIRDVTMDQLERINNECCRSFNPEFSIIIKANGIEIGIGVVFFICGRLTLEYYLYKEFQHQGYGPMFVSILSDAIGSDYPLYDTLYLLIHRDNVASIKVAQKCGYKIECHDWEFRNMLDEDMPENYLYSKKNGYYKEYKLQKVSNI